MKDFLTWYENLELPGPDAGYLDGWYPLILETDKTTFTADCQKLSDETFNPEAVAYIKELTGENWHDMAIQVAILLVPDAELRAKLQQEWAWLKNQRRHTWYLFRMRVCLALPNGWLVYTAM